MSGAPINVDDASTATVIPDIGSVYGRGDLMNIDLKDLVGNEVAIKQLINNHNDQAKKRFEAEKRLLDREGEIEFLKTSPFVSILTLLMTGGGAVVGAIGTNLITSKDPPRFASTLIWIGYGLVFIGGLANALYPYARRWFNRTKAA